MATKEADIPIKTKKNKVVGKRNLEDCEPGATPKEVLEFIENVATSPKPCQRVQPPAQASK